MDGNFMRGLGSFINALLITCIISVPLGLWKLVELIIWVARHVKISAACLLCALCVLCGSSASAAQMTLSWQDNSTNEAGFAIERATGAGANITFAEIGRVGVNATGYVDTSVEVDTVYSYRVRAYNAAGYSGYSNTASGRTLPPPPAAPGGLVVPDEPPVLVLATDVRIEGSLVVTGTITTQAPTHTP